MNSVPEMEKKAFLQWLLMDGGDRLLSKLQIRYLEGAEAFAAERGWLSQPIWEVTSPEDLRFVLDLCLGDERFLELDSQKNGNLRIALERFEAFRRAKPVAAGSSQKAGSLASSRQPETVMPESLSVREKEAAVKGEEESDSSGETSDFYELKLAVEKMFADVSVDEDVSDDAKTLTEEDRELFGQEQQPSAMEIRFGRTVPGEEPIVWQPNDTTQVFHTNMGIIGTMGTGKTQFTKSVITQLYRQGKNNFYGRDLGILIFDYKGDYNESKPEFVEAVGAKVLKTFHLPYNPLALTKTPVFRPLLPTHTANAFVDSICKAYGLGPRQQNTLFKYILMAYRQSGILPERPETWDRTPPTIATVIALMRRDGELDKNDKLASAMAKLDNFQIFEPIPGRTMGFFELLKGVVVVDLSGCDSNLQSFIVSITLDLFYLQMQAAGSSRQSGKYRELTRFILVDEADNFMSEDFPSLKRILKEGREFGVGTILTTQFFKNFTTAENDYDKYILTWVVHNVADLRAQDVDFVFGTKAKSKESAVLCEGIRQLKKHHSYVRIGGGQPCLVEDLAFWQLEKE